MAQNPKYDNDVVNLGYLNKRLGQTEESINKNNSSISQLPKNYSIPPNPPYYKDSLLCYKNKIYKCNTTKLSGVFSWNDWTIAATDDTTLSDFINNKYELEKLEIQEQIDGKVQTYYQEMDPSNEWITDLEKAKHIGDYWYNTANNTQWRYNQNTTTTPITYGWGQVNVPNSVFDLIDKKKSIYTIKPTSYKKDDLWIIEDTLSDEDLPTGTEDNPIAKGDWVFSVADSDTYNKEHWIKRDEDISLSYLEQHYYTIGDIDSSFKELERNTDSKITKAKEEISLNVSQTYTTIEEHNAAINDFDEQIGAINDTITTHETNISNLNVGVGKISASVESIESKTEELSVDIDGVKENIIPTSTTSGPNIHIEDASDKKMVNLEIEGKSTQATRSGKNLLKFANKIKEFNGVTFTFNDDGSVTINGTATAVVYCNINAAYYGSPLSTQYFTLENGETYTSYLKNTISGLRMITRTVSQNISLLNVGNTNQILSQIYEGETDEQAYSYFVIASGTVFNNLTVYPMIVKGSYTLDTIGEFEPYGVMPSPDYPSEIESVGYENLLNILDAIGNRGNNTIVSKNQEIIINTTGTIGTEMAFYLNDVSQISQWAATSYSKALDFNVTDLGGSYFVTYYLNGLLPNVLQIYLFTNKRTIRYIESDIVDNKISFQLSLASNEYIKSFQFYTSAANVFTNFSIKVLLKKGTQQHSYIPYGKYGIEVETTNGTDTNTSLFVLDQPLRSLPNGVKDIAYIKNNILYVDRKIGSRVFDGSENWSFMWNDTTYNNYGFKISISDIKMVTDVITKNILKSTHFINYTQNELFSLNDNGISQRANQKEIIFKLKNTTTLEQFKSWLSTHNTQVDYELAEPYTEKIGEVEIPSTFKDVNNITTTDELEPVMNIEYVRDTILSDYVEGQVSNAVAIQERKNAEFQITNEEIKSTVTAISTNLDGTKSSLKSVEEKITSQEKTIKIISKNIDSTTGNITEVTTTNGFTFNSNGLKIYIDENSYNTVIDNVGTYYKDGDEVINQTTKDGSILTNLSEKGQTKYSYNENDDYDFIEERIESDGEYAYATFYNGEE